MITDRNHADQASPEEIRLEKHLAESEERVAALRRGLDVTKDKSIAAALQDTEQRSAEDTRLKESLAASEQRIAALEQERDAANQKAAEGSREAKRRAAEETRLNEGLAASEQRIAALKQELAAANWKAATGSRDTEPLVAQKDGLIEELPKKLRSAAEQSPALNAQPGGADVTQISRTDSAQRPRLFATVVASMMLAGVGGLGGYTVGRDARGPPVQQERSPVAVNELQGKLAAALDANKELKRELGEIRAANDKLEMDLREAEAAAKTSQTSPERGSDDLRHQLGEAVATNRDLQNKLDAAEVELTQLRIVADQSRQQVVAQSKTVAQLKQVLSSKQKRSLGQKLRDLLGDEIGIPGRKR